MLRSGRRPDELPGEFSCHASLVRHAALSLQRDGGCVACGAFGGGRAAPHATADRRRRAADRDHEPIRIGVDHTPLGWIERADEALRLRIDHHRASRRRKDRHGQHAEVRIRNDHALVRWHRDAIQAVRVGDDHRGTRQGRQDDHREHPEVRLRHDHPPFGRLLEPDATVRQRHDGARRTGAEPLVAPPLSGCPGRPTRLTPAVELPTRGP